MTKSVIRRIALGLAAIATATTAVVAVDASADPVNSYQVNVRRCAGSTLSDVDYTFPGTFAGLQDASQQEVDSLVWGINHQGATQQVRLVQFRDSTTVSTLISSHTLSGC